LALLKNPSTIPLLKVSCVPFVHYIRSGIIYHRLLTGLVATLSNKQSKITVVALANSASLFAFPLNSIISNDVRIQTMEWAMNKDKSKSKNESTDNDNDVIEDTRTHDENVSSIRSFLGNI